MEEVDIYYENLSIKIESPEHFLRLTRDFDNKHNTKTYTSVLTLRQINDLYLHRDFEGSLEKIIDTFHTDYDSYVKMYSFYKIVKDINDGINIVAPINLHHFGDHMVGCHPGNTRMYFIDQYTWHVNVMITDYAHNIREISGPELYDIKDHQFNPTGMEFMDILCDGNPRNVYKAATRPVRIKQYVDGPTIRNWEHPPKYDIQITDTDVCVNNYRVAIKKDDRWIFDIQN